MVFRGQTLGKYRIIEPLGSGGFGTVYLAEDTWIDKRVAIKVPHRQTLDFGELLREPRLLAALNHPNIVTVVTAEKQDGVFFIVMEYVPGRDARNDHHRRRARWILHVGARLHLPDRQRGRTRAPAATSSTAICDPPMCSSPNAACSRWATSARRGSSRWPSHGTTVIGSPPYMAPEQFDGRAVFASDFYSLGVTMYQMLTGVLPYEMPGAERTRQTAGRANWSRRRG